MGSYSINILHLFPDMLNLYGDNGNIECIRKRLLWRDIDVSVSRHKFKDGTIDFENADIVFLGGGSDKEQEQVRCELLKYKNELKSFVENGKTLIAVCGGFELLGQYIERNGEKTAGLGILDIYTEVSDNKSRFIGNVILKSDFLDSYITGFENHSGKVFLNGYAPLGKVIAGYGNNGEDKSEGVIYKNLFASYLHGPLFPKNPKLCDYILTNTLKHKFTDFKELSMLDDDMENLANNYIVHTFSKK